MNDNVERDRKILARYPLHIPLMAKAAEGAFDPSVSEDGVLTVVRHASGVGRCPSSAERICRKMDTIQSPVGDQSAMVSVHLHFVS
jgi:hypothetical protein